MTLVPCVIPNRLIAAFCRGLPSDQYRRMSDVELRADYIRMTWPIPALIFPDLDSHRPALAGVSGDFHRPAPDNRLSAYWRTLQLRMRADAG